MVVVVALGGNGIGCGDGFDQKCSLEGKNLAMKNGAVEAAAAQPDLLFGFDKQCHPVVKM